MRNTNLPPSAHDRYYVPRLKRKPFRFLRASPFKALLNDGGAEDFEAITIIAFGLWMFILGVMASS